MLRRLGLPGVIRLLDEGLHHDHPFVVTELIEGAPFPDDRAPTPWAQLAPLIDSLLELLTNLHGQAVVHGDLKPGNVMVTPEQRIVLLDFGLARQRDGADAPQRPCGSPRYMAPELFRAMAPSVSTDLYAVGVMLFEALSGAPLSADTSLHGLRRARLGKPAPALRAPDAPPHVAAAVARLLAREPAQRFASAEQARAALAARTLDARALPWVGTRAPLDALTRAARAGRSLDLVADPGLGKTRALREVRAALHAFGGLTWWLTPSAAPLGSLDALRAPSDPDAPEALEPRLTRRLRALQSRGVVLIVDDADALDPWTARVVSACRAAGPVLRALPLSLDAPAARLEPLPVEALLDLFTGPEPGHMLRSDPASQLHNLTGGVAAEVARELSAWRRQSLAIQRPDGLHSITRDALERITRGPQRRSAPHLDAALAALPDACRRVLALIALATSRFATTALLAEVSELSSDSLESCLSVLLRAGLITHQLDADTYALTSRAGVLSHLDPDWLGRARAQLAAKIPAGQMARLTLLLDGEDPESLASEALALAAEIDREGFAVRAITVLQDAVEVLRRVGRPELTAPLIQQWASVALATSSPVHVEPVMLATHIAMQRDGLTLAPLDALIECAWLALRGRAPELFERLSAIPTLDHVELELRRQMYRMISAQSRADLLERVTQDVARWSERCPDPEVLATLEGWLGAAAYHRGDYQEAARACARAASLKARRTGRLSSLNMLALSQLQSFELTRAMETARLIIDEARQCRHAFSGLYGLYELRHARHRLGERLEPLDEEHLEAYRALARLDWDALINMYEGSYAWRRGELEVACVLAERSYERYRARVANQESSHQTVVMLVTQAFWLFLKHQRGDAPDREAVVALRAQLGPCAWPRLVAQALGLTAPMLPLTHDERSLLDALLEQLTPEQRATRLECLSLDEVITLVEASPQ